MKNQDSHLAGTEQAVHEWKVIEIKSEIEIKEHMSFIHPK